MVIRELKTGTLVRLRRNRAPRRYRAADAWTPGVGNVDTLVGADVMMIIGMQSALFAVHYGVLERRRPHSRASVLGRLISA